MPNNLIFYIVFLLQHSSLNTNLLTSLEHTSSSTGIANKQLYFYTDLVVILPFDMLTAFYPLLGTKADLSLPGGLLKMPGVKRKICLLYILNVFS